MLHISWYWRIKFAKNEEEKCLYVLGRDSGIIFSPSIAIYIQYIYIQKVIYTWYNCMCNPIFSVTTLHIKSIYICIVYAALYTHMFVNIIMISTNTCALFLEWIEIKTNTWEKITFCTGFYFSLCWSLRSINCAVTQRKWIFLMVSYKFISRAYIILSSIIYIFFSNIEYFCYILFFRNAIECVICLYFIVEVFWFFFSAWLKVFVSMSLKV